MLSAIEGVVYFYVFVCIMLMIFNILVIARSAWAEQRKERRAHYWKAEIDKAAGKFVLSDAQVRRLRNVEFFASFRHAVFEWVLGTESSDDFFVDNAHQFQELALYYARRPAMERAFMASFIASFWCPYAPNVAVLSEVFLSYLDDSTVYCRENVLQALYALGRPRAVANAFHILNERKWYHSPKLLADGLVTFTGDKEELALSLWRNRSAWAEPFNEATVQFASFFDSQALSAQFQEALLHEEVTTEVRFALIRYFMRRPSPDVLDCLIGYVEKDGQFAVPAAAALANYGGDRVRAVLKQALHSGNWHVRHNAALSLKRLGFSPEERKEVIASGDRYAADMLDYVMGPLEQGGDE